MLENVRARPRRLAGAPGFEPGNGGIKIRCLTTWLRPNTVGLAPAAWAGCRTIAMGPAPINVRPGHAAIHARQAPYNNVRLGRRRIVRPGRHCALRATPCPI